MSDIEETIVDSAMNFAGAIEGTMAPEEIVDSLSFIDVFYYSFDGKRHQGQIVVNSELEDDVCEIFALLEKLKFPVIAKKKIRAGPIKIQISIAVIFFITE